MGTASRRQTGRVEATAPNGCGSSCHKSFSGVPTASFTRSQFFFLSFPLVANELSPSAYFSPFPFPTPAVFTLLVSRCHKSLDNHMVPFRLIIPNRTILIIKQHSCVGNNQIQVKRRILLVIPGWLWLPIRFLSFLPCHADLYPISHRFISCNQHRPASSRSLMPIRLLPHTPRPPPAEIPVPLMGITQRMSCPWCLSSSCISASSPVPALFLS